MDALESIIDEETPLKRSGQQSQIYGRFHSSSQLHDRVFLVNGASGSPPIRHIHPLIHPPPPHDVYTSPNPRRPASYHGGDPPNKSTELFLL